MNETELINKYLGIPYRNGGRDLKGLDCWGIIVLVFKDFGINVLDIAATVDCQWSFKNDNKSILDYWQKWTEVSKPRFLDVILLNVEGGSLNHAGIYLSGSRFIHCTKAGVLVSRISRWKENVRGYYRLKERIA